MGEMRITSMNYTAKPEMSNLRETKATVTRATATFLFLILCGLHSTAAQAQEKEAVTDSPTEAAANLVHTKDDSDMTLFYAYLTDNPVEPSGPLYDFFKDKPVVKDVLMPRVRSDRKFRPMLQMRVWWEQKQRFVPVVAFCTFIAWVCWFLFPSKLGRAQDAIRTGFWRCALTGFFCTTVWLVFNRAVFFTHIGWPLGILSTGVFQAGLLVGLSVIISMIGHALAVLFRLKHIPLLGTNPAALRVTELLIGSIACGGILMLPSPAAMPHATMRLLFMFAVLGMGGVFKALREKVVEQAE